MRISAPRVSQIRAIRVRPPQDPQADWWCTNPSDVFAGARWALRSQAPANQAGHGEAGPTVDGNEDVGGVIVEVHTDEGVTGRAFIALGGDSVARVVEEHLAHLVLGGNVFDVELHWETMYRRTINIGRKGLVLEAISGVDIALWDAMGKLLDQPVYNLLGGRTKERIRAYVSRNYALEDLDQVAQEARGYIDAGFTALKMRFGYGPYEGTAGMRRNYELVRTVREAIGPDIDLAADAYMGWDVAYAIRMIRMLDEFNLAWVEEPILPDDIDGYARIRSAVATPISGGEHEFTKWGFHELISRKAVDIVQLDVNRVGGITEARKIYAMAAGANLPVIPHAQNFHNVHLITAHLNSPLIEYFPGEPPDINTLIARLFDGDPVPEDGYVTPSRRPGLGVELNAELFDELCLDHY